MTVYKINHHTLANRWMLCNSTFYFTQFYPETSNLHLVVQSSQMFNCAICIPTGQVTGTIKSSKSSP